MKQLLQKYKWHGAGAAALLVVWLYGQTEEPVPEPVELAELPAEVEETPAPPVPEEPKDVTVDVKGAVQSPGIYTIHAGARVHEAIAKAGGLASEADTNAINLAQKVQDELVIYVPAAGEAPPVTAPLASAGSSTGEGSGELISINTADAEKLQELPGIGQSKAAAIITHRETEGPFQTVEDFKNVPGIGDKTFERLAPLITVQ